MLTNIVNVKDQLYDRIAKLTIMNVRGTQIAHACGISEGRVSQIQSEDDFKIQLSELQSENLEQMDMINRGWDAIEETAMGTVLETLEKIPDPDFALRAAAMANKAQRRGGIGNQPINGGATAGAVITLNAVFIEKLLQMKVGPQEIAKEAKRVDALSTSDAENLFRDDFDHDIIKIFSG